MTSRELVGLVYNPQSPATKEMTEMVVKAFDLQSTSWTSSAAGLDNLTDKLSETSLIIVAGGDGTILRIVRHIARFNIPLLGINMGRVGFMAELNVGETIEKLPSYLNGDFRVEERMMLEASVTKKSESEPYLTLHALNDVVVGRGASPRLLDIEAIIDGVPLTSYRADAVIVSTATGSTGYALSAGGPILYPETKAMLIQPVAAHTGLSNGLILPDYSIIELKTSDSHEPVLSVDGFTDTLLHAYDTVTIKRSPYVTRFLRAHAPSTFYAALTRRLRLEAH